jgi:hypothetical protein
MAGRICVVVEVVDPGAFHRLHLCDEVIGGEGIVAIFQQGILHPAFADRVFINIGEGIRRQFQGDMLKGAVREFDRKWFGPVGCLIDLFDAVERRPVFMVIVGDVQARTGGDRDQGGEWKESV